jgi:hypothetical protein
MARSTRDYEPATLGSTLRAHAIISVWCKACARRAEFRDDTLAAQAAQHGDGLTVIEWARRLACSSCGARDADFVISGYRG